jgi:hypothetical protein
MHSTNTSSVKVRCCVCDDLIDCNGPDGYSLQVQKFGNETPENGWVYGPCLCKVRSSVGVEIPGPHFSV